MTWTLVTGAGMNIGAALCRKLAENGYPVVIHYRSSEVEAMELREDCRRLGVHAECLQGDFSSIEQTNDFIRCYQEKFLHTRALVNNVGNYLQGTALDTDVQGWHDLFQTNLIAPVQLSRALAPALGSCQGRIINLGCAGLDHRALTQSLAYNSTKEALLRFTRSLACELAADGVTVNMVSPGIVEGSVVGADDPARVPMGRLAQHTEIGDTLLYLMSAAADYITGQNIEVAGGYRLK